MRTPRRRCRCGWPIARCARSIRCSTSWPGCWSWPAARLTASEVLDLLAGRSGAQALRARRRRSRAAARARRRLRCALGSRRRPPAAVQARGVRPEHLGGGAGPAAAGRRDVRRRAHVARHRPARWRSSRATPRASGGWPSSSSGWRTCSAQLSGERPLAAVDGGPRHRARPAHGHDRAPTPGRRTRPAPSSPRRRTSRGRTPPRCRSASPTCAACWPNGCAAAPPARASAPARSPSPRSCRCARCRTASSACSASTTACSPARRASTATTCWPAVRWSASATCAARTASSFSTRSWRPPSTLVVVHSGADERTGLRRPPAVPLGELLDAVAATAPERRGGRGPASAAAVRRAQLRRACTVQLRPRRAGRGSRRRRARAGTAAVPARAAPPAPRRASWRSTSWSCFLEHPVKGFLTQRVGLSLFAGDEAPADALPVAPDGLATWAIGASAAGRPARGPRAGPLSAGRVAPRRTAARRAGRPAARHACWTTSSRSSRPPPSTASGEPADRDVDVELPDGTRVVGTVGGLHGSTVLRVEYSRLTPKQRIRSWVRLVALTAATGERVAGGHGRAGRAVRHRAGHRRAAGRRTRPARAGRAGGAAGGAGCARRCHCPPSPGTPTRASDGAGRALRRAGRGRAGVDERGGRRARRRRPRAGVGPGGARHGAHRRARAAGRRAHPVRHARARALGAAAADGGRGAAWTSDRRSRARRVRRVRPAAHRHHRAGGQRGHREDVHDRRAGGPLRRRGRGDAARADARHVRPRGHHGAARAGARPAARRPARPWPIPPRPGRAPTPVHALLAEPPRRRGRAAAGAAGPRARHVRRRHDRHHPPVLPADARRARGGGRRRPGRGVRRVDRGPAHRGRRRLLRAQVRRPRRRPAAVRPGGGAGAGPRARCTTGRPRLEPRAAEPGSVAATRYRFAAAVRAEVARRKRERRIYHLRRHAHPPRPTRSAGSPAAAEPGCGRATGWCWSTSSRTPIRCSGRSCAAPSTGTPPWC